jgi:multidomain signaling protein FimX
MTKVKQILCIYPEPAELRIHALLNRQGIVVDLVEASVPETLKLALERPAWWDLVLCDARAFYDLDLIGALTEIKDKLDASLVLLRSADDPLVPAAGFRRGAADVVLRDDLDHLLMVCERELKNAAHRKQLRALLYSSVAADAEASVSLTVATIHDPGKSIRLKHLASDSEHAGERVRIEDKTRLRSLIDAGGLTLEYQPIVSFKKYEEHRNMFETLVRLRDESGHLLLPDAFLPLVSEAGWMDKIDLWIFRQAVSVLEEMQAGGVSDAVLFVNVATETLRSEQMIRAIGAFISAAHLTPGSIVVEVRKSAFKETPDGVNRLASLLQSDRHGLLVEGVGLDDCAFLEMHAGLISHLKLDRSATEGLAGGRASQIALTGFVRCAHKEGIRVIALAVDSVALLPMFFAAGVDAIQGNLMSMPYQEMVYPSVQRIEPGMP